jgi:hypothetical protein
MAKIEHKAETLNRVGGTVIALTLFCLAIGFLFFPNCGFVQWCMDLIADDAASSSPRPLGMPLALFGLLALIWAWAGVYWD